MIPLAAQGTPRGVDRRLILRVTTDAACEGSSDHALIVRGVPTREHASAFGAVLCTGIPCDVAPSVPHVIGVSVDHLAPGDIVSVDPSGYVRTLYRRNSPHNALFATDRCNSFCLMCSQPPKKVNDSERLAEHFRLIDLIDPETRFLGITGGEPTLFKRGFIDVVDRCKTKLPNTALHVLTNGRMFFYREFAQALGAVCHPDLVLGVPLYSAVDWEHDHVVQARGAFEQTVIGLHNLAMAGVPVEIRVVVHRLTCERLVQLAEFIYRNLVFTAHVTFMGLEPMGFAVANIRQLRVDPLDYQRELRDAVMFLADRGMTVSVYNHQLCTIPTDLWPFARRSISDWKNDYLPTCGDCRVRDECGGFFSSSIDRQTYSRGIQAVQ